MPGATGHNRTARTVLARGFAFCARAEGSLAIAVTSAERRTRFSWSRVTHRVTRRYLKTAWKPHRVMRPFLGLHSFAWGSRMPAPWEPSVPMQ